MLPTIAMTPATATATPLPGPATRPSRARLGTSATSTPRRTIPGLTADLDQARARGSDGASRRDRTGRLAGLDGDGARRGDRRAYERIEEVLGRVYVLRPAGLFAGDRSDPAIGRFYQTMQERVNAITTHLLFFTLELNRLDDADARPRSSTAARRSPATRRGCATCASSGRTSSPTSSRSCCTRSR